MIPLTSPVTTAALSILLTLLCLLPAQASATPMKLLSPGTGWLVDGSRLYWTTDGGNHWTNIMPTPPGLTPGSATLGNIFFLDTSQGWAIVSYPEDIPAATPESIGHQRTVYAVAHTKNSGETWSFTPLTYPELPEWIQETFAGPASLYFLDSQHGWLDVGFDGNSKPGKLLATVDGGETWTWVTSPGFAGPMTFASLQDAFLLGYFGGERLYATHDGCKTWQEVILPRPTQVGAAIYPTFEEPPTFENGRRGFLAVQYSGTFSTPTKLVIYSTADGGQTWQPSKVLSLVQRSPGRAYIPFAIVDSHAIVSTGSTPKGPTVASVPLVNGGSSGVRAYASDLGVDRLSFADSSNGWALSTKGLIATQDGGLTWKNIAPPPAYTPQPGTTVHTTSGQAMNNRAQRTVIPACSVIDPTTAASQGTREAIRC